MKQYKNNKIQTKRQTQLNTPNCENKKNKQKLTRTLQRSLCPSRLDWQPLAHISNIYFQWRREDKNKPKVLGRYERSR